MTNIEDFLQWWDGFYSAIDKSKITPEHLDMINRKINGLQDLWDISLPSLEETIDDGWRPNQDYGWPYVPPFFYPKITPWSGPEIWCEQQQYPRVGTPLGFGTPTHVN